MQKKTARILSLTFLVILLLPVLLTQPISVLAAEEEEEDNFTVMPNYRWTNETTTDTAAQEFVSGSQYEVYNQNNETSGSQKFEKSRQLNSRDFYYESRFQLDIGGNSIEIYRDVFGDACDFEEGDDEGFAGTPDSVENGIFTDSFDARFGSFYFGFERMEISEVNYGMDLEYKIRIKVDKDIADLRVILYDSVQSSWIVYDANIAVLADEWTVISNSFEGSYIDDGKKPLIDNVMISSYSDIDYPVVVYIDYIEVYEVLDYASHVEGEVEDKWSWEDSLEYWYDDLGNVSDFNDGTTEDWVAGIYTDPVTVSDGWLKVDTVGSSQLVDIEYNSTLIDADVYKHFAMEVWSDDTSTYGITSVVFYDNDSNALFTWNDDIAVDSYGLIYGEFGGEWNGTDIELRIRFNFLGTHADNRLSVNFTYLYDTERGDLEDTYHNLERATVNPEGYYQGTCLAAIDDNVGYHNSFDIDTSLFEIVKVRLRAFSNVQMRINGYSSGYKVLSSYVDIDSSWTEHEFDLSEDSDWTGTFGGIYLHFIDDSGNLEGTEVIQIDYLLLLGHYSESDGFKFSLLNQDHEEGMYWQFTREHDTDEYTFHVDMLDVTGIALSYEQEFNYSRTIDGWLHLDVDWHLDKKTIKFIFEYENGSDIVKTRAFTDIYSTSGTGQLLLLEEGFPTLCINNSVGALARSLVLIDYIDADWMLNTWVQPDDNYSDWIGSGAWVAGNSDQFTQTGIYGASSIEEDMGDYDVFYRLDIDRFDAVSFDFSQTVENLENLDVSTFSFELVNVLPNGSLYGVAHLSNTVYYTTANYHQWSAFINDDGTKVEDFHGDVESDYTEGSVSCYRNPDGSVVMDYNIENANHTAQGSMNCPVTYSKEFLVFFNYRIETWDGADSDDIVRIKVTAFDVVRKDIFTGIIASVADAVIGFLGFILSPFIAIFMFLGGILRTGFQFVVDLLSPLLTSITTALGTLTTAIGVLAADIGTAVWSSMGNALNFITEAIGGVGAAVWVAMGDALDFIVNDMIDLITSTLSDWIDDIIGFLLPIAEDLAEIIFSVLGFFLTLIGDIIGDAINFIIHGIFFFWDLLGLPDLIAIYDEIIVGIIQVATAVPAIISWVLSVWFWWATGIFFIGFLILFAYPIVNNRSLGGFMETFMDVNGVDCTLGINLLGFGIALPIGFVFWPLFFLMFIVEAL